MIITINFSGNHIPQSKKTSPLKFKKTFKIKSPSRPKKLKHLQRLRNKRKRLTSKREVNQNEKNNNKYIPLLRNIGMLFDNILNSDSSETFNTRKYHRNQFSTDANDDITCACNKYDAKDRSYPHKKTATTSSSTEIETETSSAAIATTTTSYNSANDNVSSFGQYKNIPLLLTRNTSSIWRNNTRLSERSGSTYNGSIEGYIPGIHGNNQHDTGVRERQSDTQYHEKNTNSHSRDNTNSHRSRAGIRGTRTESRNSKVNGRTQKAKEFVRETNETFEDVARNVSEHKREIEFEIRRNETESTIFLPEFTSRLREHNSQEKNTSIRISESDEKSDAYNYTSNKRVSGRNGSDTEENKTDGGTDKAIMSLFPLSNSTFPIGKMVMIFDGYSVARDVNGENKLKEKAIHIHS